MESRDNTYDIGYHQQQRLYGLQADLDELLRMSITKRTDALHVYIRDNYPEEWVKYNGDLYSSKVKV